MKRYRIGVVSYLNTLPFLYGLRSPQIRDQAELILAHPARCAEMLANGDVDIALCPTGALSALSEWQLLTDYCIGCDGPVRTVCVYSHAPFEELETIVLSAESRTSNLLVRVLDTEYWKRGFQFKNPSPGRGENSNTGYLHIGDICFEKEQEFPYQTDLGQVWKAYSGLPFVFACWVSTKETDPTFETNLNSAFEAVMENRQEMLPPDNAALGDYLVRNISYHFDDDKKAAFRKFLTLAEVFRHQVH